MESDNPAVSRRSGPWLLIAVAVAVVALVANWMWPTSSATPAVPASNQAGVAQHREQEKIDPADLDVRRKAWSATPPGAGSVERNPFRSQPKAPPPPPPAAAPTGPAVNPGPPPVTG